MDVTRLHKYYRSSGFDLNGLIWRFLVTDNELRAFLHLSPYCGFLTFFLIAAAILILTCSVASRGVVECGEKTFRGLQRETNEKLPRKESVFNIRPAYNCIHKHLQQTDVFQEKARRLLCKEKLELEIINSRMSCITKLLKPEFRGNNFSARNHSPGIKGGKVFSSLPIQQVLWRDSLITLIRNLRRLKGQSDLMSREGEKTMLPPTCVEK